MSRRVRPDEQAGPYATRRNVLQEALIKTTGHTEHFSSSSSLILTLPPYNGRTQIIGGIEVPNTPTIKAAIAFARAHADDLTYNHGMRSFLFGFCVGSKLPNLQNRDVEVHAVSAILHDLGWNSTGELVSQEKRFEVDSAIAARSFLDREGRGWGTHKEPEVVACQLGIFMDFMGPEASPGGSLSWEEYEGIVKDFPRLKVIVGIRKIMCGLCKTKPETTYDNFVGTYGEKYVEGYSLEGKKMVDILESSNLPDSF